MPVSSIFHFYNTIQCIRWFQYCGKWIGNEFNDQLIWTQPKALVRSEESCGLVSVISLSIGLVIFWVMSYFNWQYWLLLQYVKGTAICLSLCCHLKIMSVFQTFISIPRSFQVLSTFAYLGEEASNRTGWYGRWYGTIKQRVFKVYSFRSKHYTKSIIYKTA